MGINQSDTAMPDRVLIAEDDARWLRDLDPHSYFPHCVIVDNVATAISSIESGEAWDAAIFDQCLMAGNLPYDEGRLASEAGYALAICFQRRFPGKRVVICTGASKDGSISELMREILHPELCVFIYKHDSGAADSVRSFLRGEPCKAKFSDKFLRYLELKPNFCGLGVNLENAVRDICHWLVRPHPHKSTEEDINEQTCPPEDRFVSPAEQSALESPEGTTLANKRAVVVFDEMLVSAQSLARFIRNNLEGEEYFSRDLSSHELEIMSWYLDGRLAGYYVVEAVESINQLRSRLKHLFPEIVVLRASSERLDELTEIARLVHRVNSEAQFIIISSEAPDLDYYQLQIDNIVGVIETPFHAQKVLRYIVLRVLARTHQTHISRDGIVCIKRTDLPLCIPDVPSYVFFLYDVFYEADMAVLSFNHTLRGQPICDKPVIADANQLSSIVDGRLDDRYCAIPISSYGAFCAAIKQLSPCVLVVRNLTELHYCCIMETLKVRPNAKIILVGDPEEIKKKLAHRRCEIPDTAVHSVLDWSLISSDDVFRSFLECIREDHGI